MRFFFNNSARAGKKPDGLLYNQFVWNIRALLLCWAVCSFSTGKNRREAIDMNETNSDCVSHTMNSWRLLDIAFTGYYPRNAWSTSHDEISVPVSLGSKYHRLRSHLRVRFWYTSTVQVFPSFLILFKCNSQICI